jgi:hypothetical protein
VSTVAGGIVVAGVGGVIDTSATGVPYTSISRASGPDVEVLLL